MKILKLMLVYLNDAQPSVVIFVGDRLDARGLAGAGISVQQTVIGLPARHKSLRIVDQLLLRRLIPNQIRQLHMGNIQDGFDPRASCSLTVFDMADAERLMQAKPAHAIFLIKLC